MRGPPQRGAAGREVLNSIFHVTFNVETNPIGKERRQERVRPRETDSSTDR